LHPEPRRVQGYAQLIGWRFKDFLIGGCMEKVLEKLAEQLLAYDEASLANLREKYRLRIEQFDGTKDWEKAVIVYCMINAVSLKNTLFNENMLKKKKGKEKPPPPGRPRLKRVK
jgi:hypothetical protein